MTKAYQIQKIPGISFILHDKKGFDLLHLSPASPGFYVSEVKSFENIVGKQEIALTEQFLLCQQCFLPIWRIFYCFHQIWNCHLQTLSVSNYLKHFVWERVKCTLIIIIACQYIEPKHVAIQGCLVMLRIFLKVKGITA